MPLIGNKSVARPFLSVRLFVVVVCHRFFQMIFLRRSLFSLKFVVSRKFCAEMGFLCSVWRFVSQHNIMLDIWL